MKKTIQFPKKGGELMKRLVLTLLTLFFFLSILETSNATWAETSFLKCKNITLLAASGTLTNFPVFLNISYDSDMNPDYSDLRFYSNACDKGGSELNAELENSTATNALVWVSIPQINTSAKVISMYYKNPLSAVSWDPELVWNSNYMGVWHLSESGYNVLDSTSNNVDLGNINSTIPSQMKVGPGYDFDRTRYINGTDNAAYEFSNSQSFSVEAWVTIIDQSATGKGIIGKMNSGAINGWGLRSHGTTAGRFSFYLEDNLSTNNSDTKMGSGTAWDGNWHYLVGVVNRATNGTELYLDGSLVATQNASLIRDLSSTSKFTIGGLGGGVLYNGSISETRLSNVALSSDYVSYSFSQINDSSYTTYGGEETFIPNYYYLCPNGSDANTGLDINNPIKTLSKANSLSLESGDYVLICKNSIYWTYEDTALIPQTGMYYGSYGSGEKPKIYGGLNASFTGNWTDLGGNIWESKFTSYQTGNIIFDSETDWAYNKTPAAGTLHFQDEFKHNTSNNRTYIYSVGNPATVHSEVILALGQRPGFSKDGGAIRIPDNYHNIRLDGLDVRYSGDGCVLAWANNYDITYWNITNKFCGGVYQQDTETTRYGGCAALQDGSWDNVVKYSWFEQCYDDGFSFQTWNDDRKFNNNVFAYNVISKTHYGLNPFNQNTSGSSLMLDANHVTIIDCGFGWSDYPIPQRQPQSISACFLINTFSANNSVNLTDSILYNATNPNMWVVSSTYSTYEAQSNFLFDYNLYYGGVKGYGVYPTSLYMFKWFGNNTDNLAQFRARTTNESHGVQINSSELFVNKDAGDLRPLASSIACNMSSTGSYVGAFPCVTYSNPITNLLCPSLNNQSIYCTATIPSDSDYNRTLIYQNGVNVLNISDITSSMNFTFLTSNTTYRYDWISMDNLGNKATNTTITNTTMANTYMDKIVYFDSYLGISPVSFILNDSTKRLSVTFLQKPYIINAFITNEYLNVVSDVSDTTADTFYCGAMTVIRYCTEDGGTWQYVEANGVSYLQTFNLNSTYLNKEASYFFNWFGQVGTIEVLCLNNLGSYVSIYSGSQNAYPSNFNVDITQPLPALCMQVSPLSMKVTVINGYTSGSNRVSNTELRVIRAVNSTIDGTTYQYKNNSTNANITTNFTALARAYSNDSLLEFDFLTEDYAEVSTNLTIDLVYNQSVIFNLHNITGGEANADCYMNNHYIGFNKTFNTTFVSSLDNEFYCNVTEIYSRSSYTMTYPETVINMTLNKIEAFECTGGANESYAYNFTIIDEDNKTSLLNNDIYIDLGFGEITLSFQKFNTSFVQLCTQTGQSFIVNGFIQIDNGYSTKYFLRNAAYDDTLRLIQVYNKEDMTDYSSLVLTVRDQTYKPTNDIIVKMERYYPENHTWIIVQQDKTGEFGTAFFSIKEENTKYKFMFYRNATFIDETNEIKLKCTSSLCEVSFVLPPSETGETNINPQTIFNNSTKQLNINWNDGTGSTSSVRVVVTKETYLRTETISDTTTYSSTGSINVDLSGQTGTVEVKVYSNGSKIPTLNQLLTLESTTIGSFLSIVQQGFLSLMFIMVFIGIGMISPAAVILMSLVALWLISILGLNPIVNIPFVIIASVIGIIVGSKAE